MIAEITAPNKKSIPNGEAVKVKFLSTSMTIIPVNETNKPMILSVVSRSFVKILVAIGVNTGMVAIITALMVGETKFKP